MTLRSNPELFDWRRKDCLKHYDITDVPHQEEIDLGEHEIRGVYFQSHPAQFQVYRVMRGEARLILMDLQFHADPAFKAPRLRPVVVSLNLSDPRTMIFVPHTCAHGIQGLVRRTTIQRLSDTPTSQPRQGINWNDEPFDGVWAPNHRFPAVTEGAFPALRDIPRNLFG